MKPLLAGLAVTLAAGTAFPAAAADLPYGPGRHHRVHREYVQDDRIVQVYPVSGRFDVRTYPWLHYEMRSEMICKLKWMDGRHGPTPVEVCKRW